MYEQCSKEAWIEPGKVGNRMLNNTNVIHARALSTVSLEIFTVVNNSWLKETAKIKSKFKFEQVFTTVNVYGLLKPQIINYNEN